MESDTSSTFSGSEDEGRKEEHFDPLLSPFLLNDELILYRCKGSIGTLIGAIIITNGRLLFMVEKEIIVIGWREGIDKVSIRRIDNECGVKFKNFRNVSIITENCQKLAKILISRASPIHIVNEWFSFSIKEVFEELGLKFSDELCQWKIFENNFNETYSNEICIPKRVTEKEIEISSKLRELKRFPILSYIHENKSTISRASYLIKTKGVNECPISKKLSRFGQMREVKCGPTGLGIASELQVSRAINHIRNMGIDSPMIEFVESQWIEILSNTLSKCSELASIIQNEMVTILITSPNGWFRSSLVCSITEILINPKSRTFKGFFNLIEKNWLLIGLKNWDRYSFLLVLDCIHQISNQEPTAFEFNYTLLNYIVEIGMFSGIYGTFNYDNFKQRNTTFLPDIFTHILEDNSKYLNPLYNGEEETNILKINSNPKFIRIWSEVFTSSNRINPLLSVAYDCSIKLKNDIKTLKKSKELTNKLKKKIDKSKIKISELEKILKEQSDSSDEETEGSIDSLDEMLEDVYLELEMN